MSENLKNLFIVLIIAGIIVYITNTVPKNTKQQENFLGRLFGFSKLDTLVDGIDNMDSKELDEYEQTLDDGKVEDIVNELNSDIEEDEINPVEEETNYAHIDEIDEEIDLNDKQINSNASSKLILNEINQDENDEETNDENLQQLENEEEFRQYLSKGTNSETKKDDYQVGPFVDDELQKFLLSEEGEMENIKTSKNALIQDETKLQDEINMESKYFDEEVDNEVFMEEDEDNVKQYLDYTDEEETLNEIIHRRDNKRFTNIEQIQKYLSKKYSSIPQEYPEMLPYIIEKLKDELSNNPNGLTADIINKVIKSIVGNYNKDELDEENNNYIKPFAEEVQYNEEILNEDEFSYLDEEKTNNNYIQEEKPYDEEISYEDIIGDEDEDDIKKYYKQGTLYEEEMSRNELDEEEVNYASIDVEEELDEEMRVWDEKLQNIKESRNQALKDVVTNLGNTIYQYDETIDEEVPIKKINKQVLSDILNHVDDLIPHYTTDETNDEELDEEMISNTATSKTNIRKELLDKVLVHLDNNDTVDEDSNETNDETDKSNQIKKTLKVIKKYLNKTTTDDETSNISNLADEIYQEKYLKAQKDLKIDNDNDYQSYYNEEENDEMIPKEELYPQEFIKDEEAHNEDIKSLVISLGKSLSNYHYKDVDHENLKKKM